MRRIMRRMIKPENALAERVFRDLRRMRRKKRKTPIRFSGLGVRNQASGIWDGPGPPCVKEAVSEADWRIARFLLAANEECIPVLR